MKKRIFSLLLWAVILLVGIPQTVFAVGGVTWTLEGETLTISGEGPMEDYNYASSPWFRSSITNIIIEEGVTSIGNGAFADCQNLSSVEIPSSVTSIGVAAFYDCTSLSSIKIPDSVTSIGERVFNNCTNLSSIIIPDGVTSISGDTFRECESLTNITIPEGVTSIGVVAFDGCTSLSSITIPDSVTSIDNYAFRDCDNLRDIVCTKAMWETIRSQILDATPHYPAGYRDNQNGTHTPICVCTNAGSCTVLPNEPQSHSYTEQTATDTYLKSAVTCTAKPVYYKSCVCGAFDNGESAVTFTSGDPTGHSFTNGCDTSCNNAGCTYTRITSHSHTVQQYNDTQHWKKCASCGDTTEKVNHSGGTATCTSRAVCTDCNQPYGTTLAHTHSTEWKSDKDYHWHECSCGNKSGTATHTPKTVKAKAATSEKGYTGDTVCDVCGYEIAKGEEIPVETAPDNDKLTSPETGDNSNVTVWIVLMAVSALSLAGTTYLWGKERQTVKAL